MLKPSPESAEMAAFGGRCWPLQRRQRGPEKAGKLAALCTPELQQSCGKAAEHFKEPPAPKPWRSRRRCMQRRSRRSGLGRAAQQLATAPFSLRTCLKRKRNNSKRHFELRDLAAQTSSQKLTKRVAQAYGSPVHIHPGSTNVQPAHQQQRQSSKGFVNFVQVHLPTKCIKRREKTNLN